MTLVAALGQRLKSIVARRRARYAPSYYRLHEGVARMRRRNARPILESFPGKDPNRASVKIAIFVHFDAKGIVHDYVMTYLANLVQAGYRIWFMSNAPTLREESRQALLSHVAWVHRRNNFGYDFGAYKDGILSALAGETPSEVLLCNDSVYGPFQPLGPILQRAKSEDADIWGLTESYELRYHLQSYFVLFHQAAIQNPGFLDFWRNAPYVDSRGWLIHHGEINLTQTLMAGGLRVRALFPHEAIADQLAVRLVAYAASESDKGNCPKTADDAVQSFHRHVLGCYDAGVPLNPSHFCWDVLIADLGYPFIKRDLLEFNPGGVPRVADWRHLIGRVSKYDVDQIRRHLLQRLRGRVV